ncbi:MAG: hypothetical protein ACKODX_11555 [Gemmata sp.]
MLRLALACALLGALVTAPAGSAAEPTPVEKQLAVQSAIEAARNHLDAHRTAEAVTALEREVPNADGNKVFLTLLREAYSADLARLEAAAPPDQERVAQTRRKLFLLGGEPKPTPAPMPAAPLPAAPTDPNLGPALVPPVSAAPAVAVPMSLQPTFAKPETDPAADAVAAFKQANYAEADRLFAAAGAAKLTAEQKTAWAYCRIKIAADRVNATACDEATAATAVRDLTEALQLAPQSAELQKVGQRLLKVAETKAGTAKAVAPVVASGDVIETASVRVHHGGNRELGEAVAKAAEAGRQQIFERWSGPPGGAWAPKCDVVIHATADAYAKATGKPAALTGHASVQLTGGRATSRRIDLRADDSAMLANALPRELTHVVMADMFADSPPPKWALEGMAVLAGAPEEISRYTRTLPRCARDGELRSLPALFDLKDFPSDKLTGFYCQSASVTEYLVKLNGERNFKIFLSDAQRYGTARALQRQYGIASVQALEAAWKRASVGQ